jgi:hypothetical protein
VRGLLGQVAVVRGVGGEQVEQADDTSCAQVAGRVGEEAENSGVRREAGQGGEPRGQLLESHGRGLLRGGAGVDTQQVAAQEGGESLGTGQRKECKMRGAHAAENRWTNQLNRPRTGHAWPSVRATVDWLVRNREGGRMLQPGVALDFMRLLGL